ncbi:MAG: hypothetical protein GY811_17505 [Myxococcales bacterium]|nr:hypothetical protein [Myxococcales bacterium]
MSTPMTIAKAVCAVVAFCATMAPSDARAENADATKRSPSLVHDSRTIATPTAFVVPAGVLHLGLGLEQNLRPVGEVALGLGGLEEFGLTLQRERASCSGCEGPAQDRTLAMAHFKVGSPQGAMHWAMPAAALVFRKSLAQDAQVFANTDKVLSSPPSAATPMALVSGMLSRSHGGLALHLGADLLAAQGGEAMRNALDNPTIRPALGIHYVPAAYPDTTLMADLRWVPSTDASGQWGAIWNGAAGVRYRALDWASVDLNLRLQEHQEAGDALVVLGLRATYDVAAALVPGR